MAKNHWRFILSMDRGCCGLAQCEGTTLPKPQSGVLMAASDGPDGGRPWGFCMFGSFKTMLRLWLLLLLSSSSSWLWLWLWWLWLLWLLWLLLLLLLLFYQWCGATYRYLTYRVLLSEELTSWSLPSVTFVLFILVWAFLGPVFHQLLKQHVELELDLVVWCCLAPANTVLLV